jgi:2EXR family
MDQLQKHRQLIRLRIESLERRKKVLKPHEKWPTIKAVHQYQEWKSSFSAASQLPQSAAASKTKDAKSPPAKLHKFHFPISRAKDRPMFPQFSNLPPEIRIQIWEYALFVPKFIEAQFCTQFFEPVFVCSQRNVLFSVCRESRAIALASIPDTLSLKALTLKPRLLPRTMLP